MVDPSSELERARAAYGRQVWREAYEAFSHADAREPLGPDDLWRLAMAGALLGRASDFLAALERAHHAHLEAEEPVAAARCAFWLGLRLAFTGEMGPAAGWFGRAGRLLERAEADCVERGYLLVPATLQQLASGDPEQGYATARAALEIGERFADPDLVALALHLQGRALLAQDRIDQGLALLDEAMVGVAAGEVSPLVTGIVYCSVIGACRRVFAVRRAHEWTAALTEWCERQPELVTFTGECLVFRAEILQLRGEWREAIEEARRARERHPEGIERQAAATAFYREGEVQRLLGEFDAAEKAFRSASRWGREPQPGLSLLRLAQGRSSAAASAIRRVLSESTDPLRRARLLPAAVEISVAIGDVAEARRACAELEEIAERAEAGLLAATAHHARGAVCLAEGDAGTALISLRQAWRGWQELEAPYQAARTRVLLALACRDLGDEDAATLELEAARADFQALGAAPDLARVEELIRHEPAEDSRGLTPRELQVLRLLTSGMTNRAIGVELSISERTVDRHVSNLFSKLGVSSRTAATSFAYEHDLV